MNKSTAKSDYFKVAFLGNSAVGKTSLIKYLKNDGNVPSNITATIGTDIVTVEDHLRDGSQIRYFVFDTPGQDRWKSVSFSTYKNADGVVLVYSVVDRQSFDDISRWVQDISDNCTNSEWYLVANKSDIEKARRVVSFEEGQKLADSFGVQFFETSIYDQKRPKHAVTIRQVMMTMGEELNRRRLQRKEKQLAEGGLKLKDAIQAPPAPASRCKC